MNDVSYEKSSGNVFADLGFSPAATADPSVKSRLIMTISNTMREREPTQEEAARLCRTDQPTLSKVLRGRMGSGARLKFMCGRMIERQRRGSLSWRRDKTNDEGPPLRPMILSGKVGALMIQFG